MNKIGQSVYDYDEKNKRVVDKQDKEVICLVKSDSIGRLIARLLNGNYNKWNVKGLKE